MNVKLAPVFQFLPQIIAFIPFKTRISLLFSPFLRLLYLCSRKNEIIKQNDMTILAPMKEFEAEAREVAYGLMVKGFNRDSVLLSMVEDVKWDRVLELGSLLARVNYTKVAEASVLLDTVKMLNPVALFVDSDEQYNKMVELKNAYSLNIQIYNVTEKSAELNETTMDYLRMLGRSWERKYKPNVDRRYWELYSPASMV